MSSVIGSVGGIVGGLLGGGAAPKSANSGTVYQPGGTGTQDQNLQSFLSANTSALSGASNPYVQLSPQIQQAFQTLFNSPGASGYTTAANNAGNAYGAVGNNSVNASGAIDAAALAGLPGATQVLQTGFDPQSALYSQLAQQTTDKANVTNAQYGLTGQQAASSVNQANTNFNIDWQNQQLDRQLAALGGYGNAVNSAGTAATAGQNIGAAGAGSVLAGGATPYSTSQTIGTDQENALTQYISQLLGPSASSESTISDLMQYLGLGINASEGGANAASTAYNNQLKGSSSGAAGGAQLAASLASLIFA